MGERGRRGRERGKQVSERALSSERCALSQFFALLQFVTLSLSLCYARVYLSLSGRDYLSALKLAECAPYYLSLSHAPLLSPPPSFTLYSVYTL